MEINSPTCQKTGTGGQGTEERQEGLKKKGPVVHFVTLKTCTYE